MSGALTPLCPAGHLPLKGGDRQDAPSLLYSQMSKCSRASHESISPLVGEMPGRAEGGVTTSTDLAHHGTP
ncbi:lytic murein transglycosylase [Agrobacterium fabrum]|nr:lytic murein transglycosylase [Agrobacterium fabrum]